MGRMDYIIQRLAVEHGDPGKQVEVKYTFLFIVTFIYQVRPHVYARRQS